MFYPCLPLTSNSLLLSFSFRALLRYKARIKTIRGRGNGIWAYAEGAGTRGNRIGFEEGGHGGRGRLGAGRGGRWCAKKRGPQRIRPLPVKITRWRLGNIAVVLPPPWLRREGPLLSTIHRLSKKKTKVATIVLNSVTLHR